MGKVVTVLIVCCCLHILYQDLRYRLIHGITILILSLALIGSGLIQDNFFWLHFLINVSFMAILFVTLHIYFWFRKGEKTLINRFIGMGDILVLMAFGLGYSLYNFTIFIIAGCVLTLLYWSIQKIVFYKEIARLPLAGFLCVAHLISMFVCFRYSVNPMSEQYINL